MLNVFIYLFIYFMKNFYIFLLFLILNFGSNAAENLKNTSYQINYRIAF